VFVITTTTTSCGEVNERASCVPLIVVEGSKISFDENFLLTGYQGMQKSALTVKRHFAATFVERWLVNPEVRVKLHPTKEGKSKWQLRGRRKPKARPRRKPRRRVRSNLLTFGCGPCRLRFFEKGDASLPSLFLSISLALATPARLIPSADVRPP